MGSAIALVALASCSTGSSSSGVLPGVQAIVFEQRAFIGADGNDVVTQGNRLTIDYRRYVPGGGVFVLSPPTPDGTLTNLTESFAGVDILGLDVSFDATQVVFAMRTASDDNYHIYLANVDGSDRPRKLTFGMYNDIKPIFVPGDRIAFMTAQPYTAMGTRADEYEHRREVTQLATISISAGDADRRLCAQNLSHSADPFLMSDGRVGFSRWEHLGPVNDVKLFAMNTDCTQMVAIAGQHDKPANGLLQVQEISPGQFISIATSRQGTIQAGTLVHIDARARSGATGLALDEQHARFDILTPAVPTDATSPASGVGRYRRPFPLGDGRLLVSWSDGDVNGRNELADTAPNFGLYVWDPETGHRTLVYDDPDVWELYALPVRVRDIPPVNQGVIGPAPDPTTPAVIGSVDVTVTSLDETVAGGSLDGMTLSEALTHTRRVRIIEGFSSEVGAIRQFGLTRHEGAAILGEVPVLADGSWEASIPSLLPFHLQPLDEFGLAIRNQLLWIQAMPGEDRRCGGCHEARSGTILPRTGPTTLAQQAGPVDRNIPIPDRLELPWFNAPAGENVQDVFNAACVSCHSGGAGDPFAGRSYTVQITTRDGEMLTFEIPYLDLSERLIDTYYEREVVSYPASYVSLLYPSAMFEASDVMGEMPPIWVTPGEARTSRLIAKVNAVSEDDASSWAYDTPPHPEDVGGSLTREQRMVLIRSVDLGGQYWSRHNVDGADMWRMARY
ncbi:MAG: hypothetical protein GXP55_06745 [Deltaproteobacteria bacterium]|nr:hypothetical protein [Deltaproteobacteria bacterium]